ncbi:MAG: hypothetical protein B6I37_03195 [Desulfobacteraceae bacterium 4572_35.2]|nr:MAG: hypothetical protein B6I37_03195 [Desulfobacteraceae bacterium 4572_35.2]
MQMEEAPQQPSAVSRSSRKRDAKSIEQLVHDLVDMADADFARLPASERILSELAQTRVTKGHGSRKRQLKFVAGLLRSDLDEADQLKAFVAGDHQQQRDDSRLTHQLEVLREKLCDKETAKSALEEARELFSGLDVIELKRLVGAYKGPADKKNYRQIFRCLRDGSDASLAAE